MNDIEAVVKQFEQAKSDFNARESEMDAIRNKKTELKEIIADAENKLNNWEAVAPSEGVAEAMADRQSSRELADRIVDARELMKALEVDDACHWVDLARAKQNFDNASNMLRSKYKGMVNSEVSDRLEKVIDKLRPHISGLAELAVIKKFAIGESDAIAWARTELVVLLKAAMDNVNTSDVIAHADIAVMVYKQVNTKYHHEITTASSPGYRHKVRNMKNRK